MLVLVQAWRSLHKLSAASSLLPGAHLGRQALVHHGFLSLWTSAGLGGQVLAFLQVSLANSSPIEQYTSSLSTFVYAGCGEGP